MELYLVYAIAIIATCYKAVDVWANNVLDKAQRSKKA